MKRFLSKPGILAAAAVLAGILLAISIKIGPRPAPGQAPMINIESIETLRAQFNRDAGRVRLIILVSPT